MTDYHVHIGQWKGGEYFYPQDVFAALKMAGTDEVWLSSTTSCTFCRESGQLSADVAGNAPTARDLQNAIHEEIRGAASVANGLGVKANALFWVVPDFFRTFANGRDAIDGIGETLAAEFRRAPYKGFKLHPFAQDWNLRDGFTLALARAVFSHADKNRLRVLIHCGVDQCCLPDRFEPLIKNSPNALVQLAHSRSAEKIITMLKAHPNCVCDSAFADGADLQKIRDAGLAERVVFGTDFPIAQWRGPSAIRFAETK